MRQGLQVRPFRLFDRVRTKGVSVALEIERKFLVRGQDWPAPVQSTPIRQGYLLTGSGRNLRIRQKGQRFLLTFKAAADSISRHEFEYEVPADDGVAMLALCERPPIEKIRHVVRLGGHDWEVDVFEGVNDGLILAEVELSRADEQVDLPEWLGEEVTTDGRYTNAALYQNPYQSWR